jgi:uncharacterized protein (DUF1697 family)
MSIGTQYVAFLLGINVGGHSLITMADLKAAFEKTGLQDVRTLLASGNVVFTSGRTDQRALTVKISAGLKKALGKDIGVILRSLDDIKKIRSSEPFRGIKVTSGIRLYVTFLSGKAGPRSIKIPYLSLQKEFGIPRATSTEVFSFVDLAKGKGTPAAMNIIEKEYGSNVTTRNWNTVLKILE